MNDRLKCTREASFFEFLTTLPSINRVQVGVCQLLLTQVADHAARTPWTTIDRLVEALHRRGDLVNFAEVQSILDALSRAGIVTQHGSRVTFRTVMRSGATCLESSAPVDDDPAPAKRSEATRGKSFGRLAAGAALHLSERAAKAIRSIASGMPSSSSVLDSRSRSASHSPLSSYFSSVNTLLNHQYGVLHRGTSASSGGSSAGSSDSSSVGSAESVKSASVSFTPLSMDLEDTNHVISRNVKVPGAPFSTLASDQRSSSSVSSVSSTSASRSAASVSSAGSRSSHAHHASSSRSDRQTKRTGSQADPAPATTSSESSVSSSTAPESSTSAPTSSSSSSLHRVNFTSAVATSSSSASGSSTAANSESSSTSTQASADLDADGSNRVVTGFSALDSELSVDTGLNRVKSSGASRRSQHDYVKDVQRIYHRVQFIALISDPTKVGSIAKEEFSLVVAARRSEGIRSSDRLFKYTFKMNYRKFGKVGNRVNNDLMNLISHHNH